MKVRIQPSAQRDLREGFLFYERKEAGLGAYFMDTLFSDIDSLQLFGGIHSMHFERFHRLLSKRFPYAVYYQPREHEVLVRAVLDLRRNPVWIARKLGGLTR